MELILTHEEFKDPFNRLLKGLIEGDDIKGFMVEKDQKQVQFFVGDFNLELKKNGKWEIH